MRFEQEGLRELERGAPLDPHFDMCADCRTAREFHERIRGEFAERVRREIAAAELVVPPPGWQQRILDRIAAHKEVISRRRRWMYVGGSAIAASILVALALSALLRSSAPAGLRVELQGIAGTPRAVLVPVGTVPAGTRIQIEASTGGARFAELRVYRNDETLVATAGGGAARDGLRLSLLLDAIGRYQFVLLLSHDTIPPSSGMLDADAAAAARAGARSIAASPINVR